MLATYVVYTALAAFGLQWAMTSGAASPIWPAAGLGLAAVTLWGRLMAAPIALGLITATQMTGADHAFWSQLFMGLGNASAALLGATMLRRIGPPDVVRLASLRSFLALLAAAVASAGLSALIGTSALWLEGVVGPSAALAVFKGWLFGDAVGILLVASLFLSWSGEARAGGDDRLDPRWLVLITALTIVSAYLVFFGDTVSRAWAIYPALVWAAVALRPRGAALSLFLGAVVAVTGTVIGIGPFVNSDAQSDMTLLQQYLAVTGGTILLLAAAVAERDTEAGLRGAREQELRATDELVRVQAILSLVTESAPIAIFAKDRQGRYLFANSRVFRATQTTPETLIGHTDEVWAPPALIETLRDNDLRAMNAGTPWDIEEVVDTADGPQRVWRGLKAPLRDHSGAIIGIVGVSIDITDRKAAEVELAGRTAELETLLTSAPIGLCYFTRDARYVRINQQLATENGRSIADHVGRDIEEVMGRQLPAIKAVIARVFDSGEAVSGIEIEGSTPARPNEHRHWLAGYFPVRGAAGEPHSVGCWIIEITDRKLAEERERLLAREVDHRAKNLLAVVQSVVQLSRAEDAPTLRANITGRIQSLARAHSLLAAGRWEGVNLAELAAEELAPYALERQDRVIVDGPAVQLRPAAAQSLALALHELATNAAKHGALGQAEGRTQLIWARTEDGGLALEWRESGTGPLAEPERSGFGSRVITASIERQLGGLVERRWGEDGLVVAIRLPPGQLGETRDTPLPSPPLADSSPIAGFPPPAGQYHVRRLLIVEDEALIGLEAEAALTARGFEVLGIASSLSEAFELVATSNPDAALLDLNLAGEASFPVADALIAKGVKVVFCTGYDSDRLIPLHLAHTKVLRKPFDPEDLVAAFA